MLTWNGPAHPAASSGIIRAGADIPDVSPLPWSTGPTGALRYKLGAEGQPAQSERQIQEHSELLQRQREEILSEDFVSGKSFFPPLY